MFTLAHISDVHLAPIERPYWRDLANKRIFGYLNWLRGRKDIHLSESLDRLVADLVNQHTDHIAVTGDLVNLGLPAEYEKARTWLQGLGRADRVSVVPGNHDAYVRMRRDPGIRRWAAYTVSNAPGAALLRAGHGEHAPICQDAEPVDPIAGSTSVGFPFLRRFGPVVLIGLSSAVPTPPFLASGRLGGTQREALARILARTREEGLFRIVLIHHPPLAGQAGWRRGLTDARAFAEVLAREGAELVLHGHNHRQSLCWAKGPHNSSRGDSSKGGSGKGDWEKGDSGGGGSRRIPVVGVPSASVGYPGHGLLARYNLFRIVPLDIDAGGGSRWRIEMTGRGLDPTGAHIRLLEHRVIATISLPCGPDSLPGGPDSLPGGPDWAIAPQDSPESAI